MSLSEKLTVPSKDIWDVLRSLAPFISSVAVPLVIVWVGSTYNASIKDSENRVRYVELAIAQLRTTPTPETAALREWALELLDSQSPVKLSPAAKLQLKLYALPLSVHLAGNSTATATGTGMLSVAVPSEANNAALVPRQGQ